MLVVARDTIWLSFVQSTQAFLARLFCKTRQTLSLRPRRNCPPTPRLWHMTSSPSSRSKVRASRRVKRGEGSRTDSATGAKAYHLHSVLHDWPASDCVRILEAIKPALKAGYSRILISELVVPPRDADWRVTGMDLLMMVLGSVRERTEGEFRDIIEKSGLHVVRVWYGEGGRESLIEAELA